MILPHSIDTRVLDFFKESQIRPPDIINRHSIKPIANEICCELKLSKASYSEVVASVIRLFEKGQLIVAGGIIRRVDDELREKRGRHRSGLRKPHCRGARTRAAQKSGSKPQTGAMAAAF